EHQHFLRAAGCGGEGVPARIEGDAMHIADGLPVLIEGDLLQRWYRFRVERQTRQATVRHPAPVDGLTRYPEGTLDRMSTNDCTSVRCECQAAQIESVLDFSRPDEFVRGHVPQVHLRRTAAARGQETTVRRQSEMPRFARGRPAPRDLAARPVE